MNRFVFYINLTTCISIIAYHLEELQLRIITIVEHAHISVFFFTIINFALINLFFYKRLINYTLIIY